ncbi:winged helix-turn-helix transcriptional regulator [Gracilibacillus sp. JCM 18860]|uniref:winged helix-turn-helix transcriptional regulator n=1 Tax=Gracilibacillus sp. JCM 18860 TaxID=1306159 RepID=UPI003260C131
MSQTWNQHVVKKENKSLVLETIKEKAPISRASIAQITGLNKGTVSSLVGELIDEKLINESGTGESSGGRRPVMLLLNETAGFTIAVDLGGVKSMLGGVLTDLRGGIL